MDIYLIIFSVGMFFFALSLVFFVSRSLFSDEIHFQLVWFMIFYLEAKLFRFIDQIHFPVAIFEHNVDHNLFWQLIFL